MDEGQVLLVLPRYRSRSLLLSVHAQVCSIFRNRFVFTMIFELRAFQIAFILPESLKNSFREYFASDCQRQMSSSLSCFLSCSDSHSELIQLLVNDCICSAIQDLVIETAVFHDATLHKGKISELLSFCVPRHDDALNSTCVYPLSSKYRSDVKSSRQSFRISSLTVSLDVRSLFHCQELLSYPDRI